MKKQDNSCLYLKLFPLKSLEKKSNVEHKWIIKHACHGEEAMHPCFCCLTCRITAEAAGDRKLSSIQIQQKWQACRHFIWFFFQLGSVNKCLKLFISIATRSLNVYRAAKWVNFTAANCHGKD